MFGTFACGASDKFSDMKPACDSWESRAKKGEATAQLALADCYLKGVGREPDLAKAEQWLRLAAKQEDPRAMNDLASLLLFRKDGASRAEKQKALELLRSAAEDGRYEWANFPLGLAYWSGLGAEQDVPRALKHFRLAADSDHLLANFALYCIYSAGLRGIEVDSTLTASRRKWLEEHSGRHGFSTLAELAESALADQFVRRYLFDNEDVEQLDLCTIDRSA
jgi:hypothetical protein